MQACKDGFKAGCRPIIGLDGCHLKGYHGVHLLTVVGIDANDCIYPIAFAIVETRSRPIITMLEGIRTKIMQRIAKKKDEADKWTGVLCPKIQKKLEAASEMSNRDSMPSCNFSDTDEGAEARILCG
ncbi:hypothetical protein V6N13_148561 [Hibiscus sabdariffa]